MCFYDVEICIFFVVVHCYLSGTVDRVPVSRYLCITYDGTVCHLIRLYNSHTICICIRCICIICIRNGKESKILVHVQVGFFDDRGSV